MLNGKYTVFAKEKLLCWVYVTIQNNGTNLYGA